MILRLSQSVVRPRQITQWLITNDVGDFSEFTRDQAWCGNSVLRHEECGWISNQRSASSLLRAGDSCASSTRP
jgi:hypothetical protein